MTFRAASKAVRSGVPGRVSGLRLPLRPRQPSLPAPLLDPRWLTVRYPCRCHTCGTEIKRGERAYYYPNGKTMLCGRDACGPQAERDFEAEAADEAFMSGGYY